MTINEFNREFSRLERHFRINDDDRPAILKDWFKAVSHYHVEALSHGVDQVIREATDTFWPALGKLTNAIRQRMSKFEQTRRDCPTCHGNTWIETMPWLSNGRLYEGFQRCPDCGVPPPTYTPPANRVELTATMYAQYLQGTYEHLEIPVARTHPVVKQALDAIRQVNSMKPIQRANIAQAFNNSATIPSREPGEDG